MALPHIVIIGGGFGGFEAALTLGGKPVRVTLIDRTNHHLFQPLLYQVATAGLSPGDIASPLRHLLAKHENITVRMDTVTSIDLKGRVVHCDGGEVPFDQLILAAGVRHSYFGNPGWERFAPGLKTLEDALELRQRMLSAFEAAEHESDAQKRAALLTFVIVGAGATGVELAGAIAEFARFTVAREFRNFDPRATRVVLVEAGPRALTAFEEPLALKAQRSLEKMKVEVMLSTRVTDVNETGVTTSAAFIPARTVLWAAGVAAAPLSSTLGVPLDRAGRVTVNPELNVAGYSHVYVIGDLAACTDAAGALVPGLAPAAIQMGAYVGKRIVRLLEGKPVEPFTYVDKGIMATVGRASGIGQVGPLRLSGFVGWLGWLFIHLVLLVGFENRVLVLMQWAWAWFSYSRSARLLSPAVPRLRSE